MKTNFVGFVYGLWPSELPSLENIDRRRAEITLAFVAVDRVDKLAAIYLTIGGSTPTLVLRVATGCCGRDRRHDALALSDSNSVCLGKTGRVWATFRWSQISNLSDYGPFDLVARRSRRSRGRTPLAGRGSFN